MLVVQNRAVCLLIFLFTYIRTTERKSGCKIHCIENGIALTELSGIGLQKVMSVISAEMQEIHISDLAFTEIIFILV